jgi:hypothetical protein
MDGIDTSSKRRSTARPDASDDMAAEERLVDGGRLDTAARS